MSYNPRYGGQFQGLQASSQKPSGGGGSWNRSGDAGKGRGAGGAGDAPQGGGAASSEPGEKVVVTLGNLKQVRMDEIKEEDERYFIVVGLFEGDELSNVVNHTRNRTKPVKGQLVAGNYMCSFAGEKLVLPVNDPSKRFILYIAAVTITKGENEQGKIYKDISLMGIGFSQPFEVNVCKKYQHMTTELRLVEGGDPNVNPGKLDLTIDVCKRDKGENIREDKEENIMAQFQS